MTPRDPLDPKAVDEMYGLEPVFEPGTGEPAGLGGFVTVQCPYCGEAFETAVDLSAGSFQYVEDCQVCCQPIELKSEMNDRGAFIGVVASRAD